MAKGKVIGWQWDSGSDREIGQGLCISATPEDFRRVAGLLLTYALRWPDEDLAEKNLKSSPVFDRELRGAAQHVALQMLNADMDCEPEMPFPTFRMNPENSCQMQQSVDGGTTWTTVLDTSVCMPEIPAFPTIPPMLRLRQHPDNPAILQQSLDGGSMWTTAYDYSKYRPASATIVENIAYNSQVNNFITENNMTWIAAGENPAIFAPQLVFDSGAGDVDRNLAICYACRVFVRTIMEAAFKEAEDPSFLDDLAAIAFTALGGGIGAFLGGPVGAAAGAFLGQELITLLRGAGSDWTRGTYSAYEDQLICCMYNHLKDSIPTQAAFSASFGGCSLPSDAQEFVDALVVPLLDDEQNYLTFLRLAAEGVSLAEFLPECPCVDPTGPITLTAMGYGGEVFGTFDSVVQSGEPFNAVATQGLASADDRIICFRFSVPCTVTINSITGWTFVSAGADAALYGHCPVDSSSPSSLLTWTFVREASGATSIPVPWGIDAYGVWFESANGVNFTVNMTLTKI